MRGIRVGANYGFSLIQSERERGWEGVRRKKVRERERERERGERE